MRKFFLTVLCCCFFNNVVFSSSVIILEYHNATDPKEEWTHLLVVENNVDIRGWSIQDNNSSGNSWQIPIEFSGNLLWSNLTKGTHIKLFHRIHNSEHVKHTEFIDINSGHIQLSLQNSIYFKGGYLGNYPAYGGLSMDINVVGDAILLKDKEGQNQYMLAHGNNFSDELMNLDVEKQFLFTDEVSFNTIVQNPCLNNNFKIYTTSIAEGLYPFDDEMKTCIEQYRIPSWYSQPLIYSNNIISWQAYEPNDDANLYGYMILGSTDQIFENPSQGYTYNVSENIGEDLIVAIHSNILENTFDVSMYPYSYYKVILYKFNPDTNTPNGIHPHFGRAYNLINTVQNVIPLKLINSPITIISEIERNQFTYKMYDLLGRDMTFKELKYIKSGIYILEWVDGKILHQQLIYKD